MARPRLGRGIAALLGDVYEAPADPAAQMSQVQVPIFDLRPNPHNPRKSMNEEHLEDLTRSIKERGIIQPILVRYVQNGAQGYEIIAGERRWRAAQRAGLSQVPILVMEASDRDSLEIALVENIQRADLNPIEEAQGYEHLLLQFNYTQQELSRLIGKSRSHIANTMRLLKLPEGARQLLLEGKITAGHARALLSVEDPDQLAQQVLEHALTVRDVERLVQDMKDDAVVSSEDQAAAVLQTQGAEPSERGHYVSESNEGHVQVRPLSAFHEQLAGELKYLLNTKITLHSRGEGGEIRIKYKTQTHLEQLRNLLLSKP